jgi:hypothetical protein
MELNQVESSNHERLWKIARWGVIIFCVIHFFFEALSGNSKFIAMPILFNYWISAWYIKKQIAAGKEIKYLLLFGLSVSFVVFLIRLALGMLFFSQFIK